MLDGEVSAAQRSQPEFDFDDEAGEPAAPAAATAPVQTAPATSEVTSHQSVVEAASAIAADAPADAAMQSEAKAMPPATPEPIQAPTIEAAVEAAVEAVEPSGGDVAGPHIDEVAVAANDVPAAAAEGELEPVSLAPAASVAVGMPDAAEEIGRAPGLFDAMSPVPEREPADAADAAATAASQLDGDGHPAPEERQGA